MQRQGGEGEAVRRSTEEGGGGGGGGEGMSGEVLNVGKRVKRGKKLTNVYKVQLGFV